MSNLLRAVCHALAGAMLGALFGYLFLLYLIPVEVLRGHAAELWMPFETWSTEWLCAALGAVAGVVLGVPLGLVAKAVTIWHARRSYRGLARSMDPGFSAVPVPDLGAKLAEVFPGSAGVEAPDAVQMRIHGIRMAVGVVRCTRFDDPDGEQTTRQTFAYYESDTLRFPAFVLEPPGRALTAISELMGMRSIHFPEHPAFSQVHHLGVERESDARKLFSSRLLELLGRRPGLHVQSVAGGLVLFFPGQLLRSGRLKDFVSEAADIFRLFERAARASGFTRDRVKW